MTNAKLRILEKHRAARREAAERAEVLAEAIETGNYGILDDPALFNLAKERDVVGTTLDGVTSDQPLSDELRDELVGSLQEWDEAKSSDDEGSETPDAAGDSTPVEEQDSPVDYEQLSDEQLAQVVAERNDVAETSDALIDSDDRETIIGALQAQDAAAAATPAEDGTEQPPSDFDADAHVNDPVTDFHAEPKPEAIPTPEGGVVTPDAAVPESIADGGTGDVGYPVDQELSAEWTHKEIDAYAAGHAVDLPKGNITKQEKVDLIVSTLAERSKG